MIDGLADYTVTEDHKTTLQKAFTPTLDSLAAQNISGIHDPVQSGLACGSDTAHMSIFGYEPLKYYDGRGGFECLGSGLDLEVGDIGFKSNFAFMDTETGIVIKRRVDRQFPKWGLPLCEALNGITIPNYPDHTVFCKYATEHRCVIKITGPNLSNQISGNDPLKDNLPLVKCIPTNKAENENADPQFTSDLVNATS